MSQPGNALFEPHTATPVGWLADLREREEARFAAIVERHEAFSERLADVLRREIRGEWRADEPGWRREGAEAQPNGTQMDVVVRVNGD